MAQQERWGGGCPIKGRALVRLPRAAPAPLPADRTTPPPRTRPSRLLSLPALPFNAVYCASKFALEGLCESLSILLQPFGVQ